MTPFHVGMKVVCIKDVERVVNDLGLRPFKKGQILTIADFYDCPEYGLFLIFEETGRNHLGHHRGFRPVVKTSIDTFTAMLAPAPKQTVGA